MNGIKSEVRELWLRDYSKNKIRNALKNKFSGDSEKLEKIISNYAERDLYKKYKATIIALAVFVIIILIFAALMIVALTAISFAISPIFGVGILLLGILIMAVYAHSLNDILKGRLYGYSALISLSLLNIFSTNKTGTNTDIMIGVGINLIIIAMSAGLQKVLKVENTSSEDFSDNTLSQTEEKSKNYIEQYKSQYSRDSIKKALVNTGIAELEVEGYLNKYF